MVAYFMYRTTHAELTRSTGLPVEKIQGELLPFAIRFVQACGAWPEGPRALPPGSGPDPELAALEAMLQDPPSAG